MQSTMEECGPSPCKGCLDRGTGRTGSRAGEGSPSVDWLQQAVVSVHSRLVSKRDSGISEGTALLLLGRTGLTQSRVPGTLCQNRFM